VLVVSACGISNPFRPYEYEEDVYLSLEGSATLYVNPSIAALNALRGTAFVDAAGRVDREPIRQYYSSAHTRVARVQTSRRSGRSFVHVRLEIDDVNRLSDAAPFAWSAYRFRRNDDLYVFTQAVGPSANSTIAGNSATGREIVAFRLHLPSKITWHDNGAEVRRGNILAWEQPLSDRLRSVPLAMEARMETQSILYRTLYLFGATFIAVAAAFVVLIWWIVRRSPSATKSVSKNV